MQNQGMYDGQPGVAIYRAHFKKLLELPKPIRDQLFIELPTLMGLRAGELVMIRREDIDFERGDLMVLDSKKHEFYPVPLDLTVADHLDKLLGELELDKGYIFRRFSNTGRPSRVETMNVVTVESIWGKYCKECGIPVMAPRYGRAFFALNWHVIECKSLVGLMRILRHTNLSATEKYLSKLYFYEDIRNEFYRGKKSPFISDCSRSASCPVACEGCHCRAFQPLATTTTTTMPTRQPVS